MQCPGTFHRRGSSIDEAHAADTPDAGASIASLEAQVQQLQQEVQPGTANGLLLALSIILTSSWKCAIIRKSSWCCHAQVLAASQRVMQLRSSVPAALSENLREKLEQCRPACEPPAAEADAQQDAAEGNGAALSPAPAELQGSLASAVLKMPTLRSVAPQPLYHCMAPVRVLVSCR